VVTVPSVAVLVEELADAYRLQNPGLLVLVDRVRGAPEAAAALRAGRADLAVTTSSQLNGGARRLGWRPLLVATGSTAGVDSISSPDLARVYSQEVTLWSELGSASPLPITPVDRPGDHEDHLALARLLYGAPRAVVANALLVPDDERAAAALAGRGGAIGYLGRRAATGLHLLPLDGVAAEPDLVRQGRYPLTESIVAQTGASAHASGLVAFALAGAGQRVIDQREVGL
jgi:ABC-type phosphate transport system substrate-binding protein